MKIVEPSVEYLKQEDPITHVAKCGHICYASPSKGYEADKKFYNALISSNHISVLRHESCYFIVPENTPHSVIHDLQEYGVTGNPYINITYENGNYYIVTNANFLLDNQHIDLSEYKVTPDEFYKVQPEMMRYTFCLTTQISTSRELNRTANVGITEMSTRYIKFGGKIEPSIVRPWWFNMDIKFDGSNMTKQEDIYFDSCLEAFNNYQRCLETGLKPEDARGVLPLDTMTKVIYTMSMSQWRRIIDMRLNDSTGRAHGNCHVIVGMVKDELEKLGYKF